MNAPPAANVVIFCSGQRASPQAVQLAAAFHAPIVSRPRAAGIRAGNYGEPSVAILDVGKRPQAAALCRALTHAGWSVVGVGGTDAHDQLVQAGAWSIVSPEDPHPRACAAVAATLNARAQLDGQRHRLRALADTSAELERLRAQTDLVAVIAEQLNRVRQPAQLPYVLYEHLLPFLTFDSLAFLWARQDQACFIMHAHFRVSKQRLASAVKKARSAYATLTGKPLAANRVAIQCPTNEFFSCEAKAVRRPVRAIHLPLVAAGEPFGVVQLMRPRSLPFTAADLALFGLIVGHLATALHDRLLLEQLHRVAITDSLTRLYNRRHLQTILAKECARAVRHGLKLAVAMLDIDHFKRINDTHGHAAGDVVLIEVGRRLQQSVRESDSVFRYGGEEFAVLLPETSQQHAVKAIERLRRAIAASPVPTQAGPLMVTISAGVAGRDAGAPLDGEALLRRADQALYLAKQQGRNRVCASPD